MANKYIKQHILPKTYLKHFSTNEDGIGIHVIDNHDKYKDKVQIKNSGDKIFWEKKFYNSQQFSSSIALEKAFGQKIEPFYHDLILTIKKEEPIEDWDIKLKILAWMFFAIQRTPHWRWIHKGSIRLRKWLMTVYPNLKSSDIEEEQKNIEAISKELHLKQFADKEVFAKNLGEFGSFVINKRWKILKCHPDLHWITTDNPGFLMKYKEDSIVAVPTLLFKDTDGMFFPLTKDYGIEIYPYSNEDSVELNLSNTIIEREQASYEISKLFNRFSFATMHRLLLSPDKKALIELAEDLKELRA